ncbi:cytochrome c oxidase assembly factor 1 homolog [Centruroides vittatus]|uniref:cytochrome c oxidase assembly factor 1 homolog n=1 Tax=Centruroides vittatus TaxID=120091 RepID=UPI00350F0885
MDRVGNLLKYAAITGIACSAGGLYIQSKIRDNMKKGNYYSDSLKLLRQHTGAADLLGQPIKVGKLDLGDEENYLDGLKTTLKVPVKGPKEKGHLFIWADRQKPGDIWTVQRLELSLNKIADSRLLIFDKSKEEDVKKQEEECIYCK